MVVAITTNLKATITDCAAGLSGSTANTRTAGVKRTADTTCVDMRVNLILLFYSLLANTYLSCLKIPMSV